MHLGSVSSTYICGKNFSNHVYLTMLMRHILDKGVLKMLWWNSAPSTYRYWDDHFLVITSGNLPDTEMQDVSVMASFACIIMLLWFEKWIKCKHTDSIAIFTNKQQVSQTCLPADECSFCNVIYLWVMREKQAVCKDNCLTKIINDIGLYL